MDETLVRFFLREKPTLALLAVEEMEPAYAALITKRIDSTFPHTSSIISELEEHGLIKSRPEGRIRYLELTDAIEDQTADVVEQTTDWRGVLDEVANIFQVLGISASSAFGKILGGLSAGMAGLQRAKEIGGIGIVKNESGKTNWGQTFASLGAGMQMVGSAISIGKAIVGLFKSDPIKKAQKQAGQILGVGISRELAEAISKQAKSLGISVQKASLLNISAAMGESGKDPRQFANQITSLRKAIKDGSVPAAQGLEELGKSFTPYKPSFSPVLWPTRLN